MEEPSIRGAPTASYTWIFDCAEGWHPPHAVVQEPTINILGFVIQRVSAQTRTLYRCILKAARYNT